MLHIDFSHAAYRDDGEESSESSGFAVFDSKILPHRTDLHISR